MASMVEVYEYSRHSHEELVDMILNLSKRIENLEDELQTIADNSYSEGFSDGVDEGKNDGST